ncbi:UNVERIFIED_CONTAM: hypothetical protein Sradi_1968500 [Sesamum radiatum]|uniref:Uncharacterized protein n=1 Tax=Sesamum radiatum TaxID=300843 RepID=A0AAW2TF40_SESRA
MGAAASAAAAFAGSDASPRNNLGDIAVAQRTGTATSPMERGETAAQIQGAVAIWATVVAHFTGPPPSPRSRPRRAVGGGRWGESNNLLKYL